MNKEDKKRDLSFLETIVLLALDDKGQFGNSENRIRFGLAGAVLFELERAGKIQIQGNQVGVVSTEKTGNKALDAALEALGKPRKKLTIRKAIRRIVSGSGIRMKSLLKKLIRKNILKREKKSFLRVFYINKYPLVNREIKDRILDDLYRKLMGEDELTDHDLLLLSIMQTCRMTDKNYPIREHFLKVRSRIREITGGMVTAAKRQEMILNIRDAVSKSIRQSNMTLHI